MKLSKIFVPNRNSNFKLEEFLKEDTKPSAQIPLNKQEIPAYAVQENGDYLVMRSGIIMDMPDCKSITNANFYFTINGEEHKLHRGIKSVNLLDEKRVIIEESLVSELFEFGRTASEEPDVDVPSYYDHWKTKMKHATGLCVNSVNSR